MSRQEVMAEAKALYDASKPEGAPEFEELDAKEKLKIIHALMDSYQKPKPRKPRPKPVPVPEVPDGTTAETGPEVLPGSGLCSPCEGSPAGSDSDDPPREASAGNVRVFPGEAGSVAGTHGALRNPDVRDDRGLRKRKIEEGALPKVRSTSVTAGRQDAGGN